MSFKVFSLLVETSVSVYSSPLHSPQTPGTDLFIVSIVLSFPEQHIEPIFFFLSFPLNREVQSFYVCKIAHGIPMYGPNRLQVANSPTKYCSFPSNIEPCPTGPAQQPRGGTGGHVLDTHSQKARNFVPLVTMNPDSCWVCCKQRSHFFRPPTLSYRVAKS